MNASSADSGKPRRGRASWRGKGQAAGPANKPPRRRYWWGWHEEQAWGRTARRLATACVLTGLLALLIFKFLAWLAPTEKSTPLLLAAFTRYDDPLPPNAWAQEDIDRFQRDTTRTSSGKGRASDSNLRAETPKTDAKLVNLLERLQATKPGGPAGNVILLYVSAHGVLDDAGEPRLILPDPAGTDEEAAERSLHLDPARWLSLASLVREIHKHAAKGAKSVLFLDCTRMHANWSMGLLYNGFAEKLPEMMRQLRDDGVDDVFIINASGPGQVSWAAPELRGTAFAHFLERGLLGFDGASTSGGRVTLHKLRDALAKSVSNWVWENRLDMQVPMLVPPDAPNVDLTWSATDREPVTDKSPLFSSRDREHWVTLGKLWKRHDEFMSWENKASKTAWYRGQLLELEDCERSLCRFEQLAVAGKAYAKEATELLDDLETTADKLAKSDASDLLPSGSFPMQRAWLGSQPPDDGSGEKTRQREIARIVAFLQSPPPEAELKKVLPGLKKLERSLWFEAAWQWLLAGAGPQPAKAARALEWVPFPAATQGPELAEMHLLRVLSPQGDLSPSVLDNEGNYPQFVKLALAARQLAEEAACPADERAHYFIRHEVEAGDARRRLAEDRLFIGNATDLEQARAAWSGGADSAEAMYQGAQAHAVIIQNAWLARDRGFSQAPHLARWLARRAKPKEDMSDVDASMDRLLHVIADSHELGKQLDLRLAEFLQPEGDSAQRLRDLTQLQELTRKQSSALGEVRKVFLDSVDEQRKRARDRKNFRDLESLLSVPLVPAEDRGELRKVYLNLLALKPEESAKTKDSANSSAPPSDSKPDRGYLERVLQGWERHPALALLDRTTLAEDGDAAGDAMPNVEEEPLRGVSLSTDANAGKAVARLSQLAKEARRLLLQIDDQVTLWLKSPAEKTEDPLLELVSLRGNLSRADRLTRASLALVGRQDRPRVNAARGLVKLDRHALLIWHGERACQDFWGPRGTEGETESYFVLAAERYLRGARQAVRDLNLATAYSQQLQSRRDALASAVPEMVSLSLPDRQIPEEVSVFSDEVTLRTAGSLPQGKAALLAVELDGTPIAMRGPAQDQAQTRLELTIPVQEDGGEPWPLEFHRSPNSQAGQRLTLRAWYRGHRRDKVFHVIPLGRGLELAHEFHKLPTPKVTVRGKAKSPGAVAIVLDCSSSMKEPAKIGGRTTRMDEARSALEQILAQLARDGGYDVRLWLYGHRVGLKKVGDRYVADWNDGWGEKPDPLPALPSEDVEMALRTGKLNEQTLGDFEVLLQDQKKIRPWGGTPLYLAVYRAVNDLADLPEDEPRRLVVITDGKNDVYKPRAGVAKSLEDVVDVFVDKSRGLNEDQWIRFDLVGCAADDASRGELRQLADRVHESNSSDYPATFKDVSLNMGGLLGELRTSLGLYEYEILPDEGNAAPFGPTELGLPTEVDRFRPGQKFKARLRTSSARPGNFKLDGGESLVLVIQDTANGMELIHRPYDRDGQTDDEAEAKRDPTIDHKANADFDPAVFAIRAHRPETMGSTMRFPISVQNSERGRFSPRPKEAWVEITPLADADGTPGFTYPFYDLAYELEPNVPVLTCDAPRWDPDWGTARIDMWFKLGNTDPSVEKAVVEVRSPQDAEVPTPHRALDLVVDRATNAKVRFAVQIATNGPDVNVRVTQISEDESGLHPVRVEMSPAPAIARHEYFTDDPGGRVLHTFVYQDAKEDEVLGYLVRITSQQDLKQGAVHLDRPLTARIVVRPTK